MKQQPSWGRPAWLQRPAARGVAAFTALALLTAASLAPAQDSGALVDKLVQKGILTEQEGTDVRAEMQQDAAQSPTGKISLSNSVTQLNLYGDLRLRWQYNDSTPVVNSSSSPSIEQDRFRYRLRLNADVQLGRDWFVGLQLQTGQTSDSGNQTYGTTFNNDSIYISRAFLGYQNDWLKVVVGKQPNPFYSTDLLWDPDINPAGLTETIALHKLPLFGGGDAGPDGSGKGGDIAPTSANPWEVSLVAGQFILGDNSKFANTGDLGTDPWVFDQQLIVKYNFNKNISATFAPGFLAENAAHVSGALNTLPFSDEGAVISGTTAVTTTTQEQDIVTISYSAKGVPTKTITPTTLTTTSQTQVTPNNQTEGAATVSGPRTITSTATASHGAVVTLTGAAATGLPVNSALANQTFTSTTTAQKQSVSTTNNVVLPEVSAETAALHILTAPGDISFTLGGIKSKLYWDLAYNVSGRDRFDNVYQMKEYGSEAFKPRDAFAWLVGLQFGEIKKKGDWQAFVNYRQTGIASIDPNLNDNEDAGGALNMSGFKLSLAYSVTDFVVVQATGYLFRSLDKDLSGGRATSPGGIAPYGSYNETTLEVNIKF